VLPAFGVMAVLAGASPLVDGHEAMTLVFGLVFIVAAMVGVWGMFFLPIPRWFVPQWFREELTRRRHVKESIERRGQAEREAKRETRQERGGGSG